MADFEVEHLIKVFKVKIGFFTNVYSYTSVLFPVKNLSFVNKVYAIVMLSPTMSFPTRDISPVALSLS